ncbi:NAD-dependent epimerase/dehydratase family protein [Microbacterium schleiferi]|uniref:NAD-dependent epimerase/dehydratase family protein n=1 Tax=Microbacterium schleiferi TaxID=69362 RepID=A0A7S8MY73_9MICO|nr:NAD-dependent epimerase/dehydratase family protein [Microbacterium schleiferi]QPE05444.1 NAD-dependent epimerase/dehydratase family protein [Microbacterium schleiferi]
MSTAPHVIVGAGPVGSSLARILTGDGESVIVVTRSGRTPAGDGLRSVAADASDPDALSRICSGAAAIYNCANPGSYVEWERLWPPLASALLTAAESTGAVLVTMSNLYGYGPVTAPMTAGMPLRPTDHKGALRARMWEDARAAHEAGRIRATEARASDYIGPTLPVASGLLARYAQSTLAGKPASVFADPDVPHAWTAIDDVARTLATLGRDDRAWGRPWLVPTNPPVSVRDTLRELSAAAGAPEPRLRLVPRWLLRAGGVAVPLLREVNGMLYQFDAPFEVDATETEESFGIRPTTWDGLITETARAWRQRLSA